MTDNELLLAISNIMDEKLSSIKATMTTKDDLKASEKIMLDEIERLHSFSNDKIDTINTEIKGMKEDIHITRYSNETVELLLKKVDSLEKRIESLEHTA